jgi:hypothetical protein
MPKVATPLGWDVVLGIRIIGTPEPCGFVFDTTPGSARQVTLPRGGGLERCPDVGDCREANPGQENRAPQDDSPGLLRAPLTTATTKWHLAQCGIDTPQAPRPEAERKTTAMDQSDETTPGGRRPPSPRMSVINSYTTTSGPSRRPIGQLLVVRSPSRVSPACGRPQGERWRAGPRQPAGLSSRQACRAGKE